MNTQGNVPGFQGLVTLYLIQPQSWLMRDWTNIFFAYKSYFEKYVTDRFR